MSDPNLEADAGGPAEGVRVDVLRVFTDEDGQHGNLLGIVDGSAVPPADRQRFAAAVGFSETVFVEDAELGRLRIFTPAAELPFAGHPTVGTAWWLRRHGHDARTLVLAAGTVEVRHEADLTRVLSRVKWSSHFAWRQLESPADVEALEPSSYVEGLHYLWAWIDEEQGTVRSRMFAPDLGIVEDQATGSAAVGLTGVLERDLDITQGMGSRIHTTSESEGWAWVGGRVVAEQARTISI